MLLPGMQHQQCAEQEQVIRRALRRHRLMTPLAPEIGVSGSLATVTPATRSQKRFQYNPHLGGDFICVPQKPQVVAALRDLGKAKLLWKRVLSSIRKQGHLNWRSGLPEGKRVMMRSSSYCCCCCCKFRCCVANQKESLTLHFLYFRLKNQRQEEVSINAKSRGVYMYVAMIEAVCSAFCA